MDQKEEKIQVALGTAQQCTKCGQVILMTKYLNNTTICNSCIVNGLICHQCILIKYLNGLV